MPKNFEDKLTSKTAELERFFNINLDLLCIADLEGNFIKVNKAWEEILGYSAAELERRKFLDFIHPDDLGATLQTMEKLANNEQILNFINRYRCRDGSFRYIEWRSQPYQGLIYAAARDITERKLTEEALFISEERFSYAMKGTRAGLWDWDMQNDFVFFSPQWKSMLGYTEIEIENNFYGWKKLWHPDDVLRIEQALNDYLAGKTEIFEIDHRLLSKNGNWRWILTRGETIKDSSGQPYRWIGTNIDITHLKVAEEKIRYLSFRDQLTGLYNRRFYEEELKRVDTERSLPLSLVIADVNGLKLANDSFGHLVGDELLQRFAEILKKDCRSDEIIARIGGDEFVILLPKTDAAGARSLVMRITKSLADEKMGLLDLSASFGWATKTHPFENIEDVFKKAEDNMYQQKLHESPKMKVKTIQTIISAVYNRLPAEKEHSQRVSSFCETLGRHLGFTQEDLEELSKAALLHDIGKITMSETILNKPGKLIESEWSEVKRHSETGFRILGSVNDMAQLAKFVLHHHERWDGKGYPNGLKGQEIPLQSRIICVADAYDAMTSERSYRKSLSKEEARAEIEKNAGLQFDPDISKLFIEKVLKGK